LYLKKVCREGFQKVPGTFWGELNMKRILSLITLLVFTWTSLLISPHTVNLSWAQSVPLSVNTDSLMTNMFSVPAQWGTVKEHHVVSKDNPFVVLIEDAHNVDDAQVNIQQLIQFFQEKHGIQLTAFEGATGRTDPLIFREFPDEARKEKVFTQYLEQGELTGIEMAALFNAKEGIYEGMEDWELYQENYFAYLKVIQGQDDLLNQLNQIRWKLDQERKQVYTESQNQLHEAIQGFREERLALIDFLHIIHQAGGKTEKPSEAKPTSKSDSQRELIYPQLFKLFSVIQNQVNQTNQEIALKSFIDEFKQSSFPELSKEEQIEFNANLQEFFVGRTDGISFLQWMVKRNIAGSELPQELEQSIVLSQKLSTIKGTQLFSEIDSYVEEIQTEWMKTREQKILWKQFKDLETLKNLAKLELSKSDLVEMSNDVNQPLSEAVLSFLERLNQTNFSEWMKQLTPAIQYYNAAIRRDLSFYENLKQLMEKHQVNTSMMVLGGFHSSGVKKILKENNVSYAVVMPTMHSDEGHENYSKVMQGHVSYAGDLNTTFYDAFVNDAIKQLTVHWNSSDVGSNLKMWRDNIIRKLSEAGRITQAKQYTTYLDRVIQQFIQQQGAEGFNQRSKQQILENIKQVFQEAKQQTIQMAQISKQLVSFVPHAALIPSMNGEVDRGIYDFYEGATLLSDWNLEEVLSEEARGASLGGRGDDGTTFEQMIRDRIYLISDTLQMLETGTFPNMIWFGDKHGEVEDIKQIVEEASLAHWEERELVIIGHGDTFDRGKNNVEMWGLLKELMSIDEVSPYVSVHLLLGNHEEMMIVAQLLEPENDNNMEIWLDSRNGGDATFTEFQQAFPDEENHRLLELSLWLLEHLKLYFIDEAGYVHVHAGIPFDAQNNPVLNLKQISEWQGELESFQEELKEKETLAEKIAWVQSPEVRGALMLWVEDVTSLIWTRQNTWLNYLKINADTYQGLVDDSNTEKLYAFLEQLLGVSELKEEEQEKIRQRLQFYWPLILIQYGDFIKALDLDLDFSLTEHNVERLDQFLIQLGALGIVVGHNRVSNIESYANRILMIDAGLEVNEGHVRVNGKEGIVYHSVETERLVEGATEYEVAVTDREDFIQGLEEERRRLTHLLLEEEEAYEEAIDTSLPPEIEKWINDLGEKIITHVLGQSLGEAVLEEVIDAKRGLVFSEDVDAIDQRLRGLASNQGKAYLRLTLRDQTDLDRLMKEVAVDRQGNFLVTDGPLVQLIEGGGILLIDYTGSNPKLVEGFNSLFDKNPYFQGAEFVSRELNVVGVMRDDQFQDFSVPFYSRFQLTSEVSVDFEDPIEGIRERAPPEELFIEGEFQGERLELFEAPKVRDSLLGNYSLDEEGVLVVQEGALIRALRKGNPLLIQGADWAYSDVAHLLRQIILSRKVRFNGETIYIPEDFEKHIYVLPGRYQENIKQKNIMLPSESQLDAPLWVVNQSNQDSFFSRTQINESGQMIQQEGLLSYPNLRLKITRDLPDWIWHRIIHSSGNVEIEVLPGVYIPSSYRSLCSEEFKQEQKRIKRKKKQKSWDEVKELKAVYVQSEDLEVVREKVIAANPNQEVLIYPITPETSMQQLIASIDITSADDTEAEEAGKQKRIFSVEHKGILQALLDGYTVILEGIHVNQSLPRELETLFQEKPYLIVQGDRIDLENFPGQIIISSKPNLELEELVSEEQWAQEENLKPSDEELSRILEKEFPEKFSQENFKQILFLREMFESIPEPEASGQYPKSLPFSLAQFRLLYQFESWVDAFEQAFIADFEENPEAVAYMRTLVRLTFKEEGPSRKSNSIAGRKLTQVLNKVVAHVPWETQFWQFMDTLSLDVLQQLELWQQKLEVQDMGFNSKNENHSREELFDVIKKALIKQNVGVDSEREEFYRHRFKMEAVNVSDMPKIDRETPVGEFDPDSIEKKITEVMAFSPAVMLKGGPGTGKSHTAKSVAEALRKQWSLEERLIFGPLTTGVDVRNMDVVARRVYEEGRTRLHKEAIAHWADSEEGGILIVDEANLTKQEFWNFLKGVFAPEPFIWIDGKRMKLSKKHRVIFTGNQEFLVGRNYHELIQEYMPTFYFPGFSEEFFKERVEEYLRPEVSNRADVKELVLYLHHLFGEMDPQKDFSLRDIQELVRRINYQEAEEATMEGIILSAWELYHGGFSVDQRDALDYLIQIKFGVSISDLIARRNDKKKLEQEEFFSKEGVDWVGSATALALSINDFLELREKRLASPSSIQGKPGMIFEGPSGRGKDIVLMQVLREGKQFVDGANVSEIQEGEEGWEHPTQRYYRLNASLNADEIIRTIRKAQKEGSLIILSEMNLLPSAFLEGKLNDVLTGTAHEGFAFFGTINSMDFSGKEKLSTALQNRVIYQQIEDYPQEELRELGMENRQRLTEREVNLLTNVHVWLRGEIKQSDKRPTTREFLRALKWFSENKKDRDVSWQEAVQQIYGPIFLTRVLNGLSIPSEEFILKFKERDPVDNIRVLQLVAGYIIPRALGEVTMALDASDPNQTGGYYTRLLNSITFRAKAFKADGWQRVFHHEASHGQVTRDIGDVGMGKRGGINPVYQDLEDIRHERSFDGQYPFSGLDQYSPSEVRLAQIIVNLDYVELLAWMKQSKQRLTLRDLFQYTLMASAKNLVEPQEIERFSDMVEGMFPVNPLRLAVPHLKTVEEITTAIPSSRDEEEVLFQQYRALKRIETLRETYRSIPKETKKKVVLTKEEQGIGVAEGVQELQRLDLTVPQALAPIVRSEVFLTPSKEKPLVIKRPSPLFIQWTRMTYRIRDNLESTKDFIYSSIKTMNLLLMAFFMEIGSIFQRIIALIFYPFKFLFKKLKGPGVGEGPIQGVGREGKKTKKPSSPNIMAHSKEDSEGANSQPISRRPQPIQLERLIRSELGQRDSTMREISDQFKKELEAQQSDFVRLKLQPDKIFGAEGVLDPQRFITEDPTTAFVRTGGALERSKKDIVVVLSEPLNKNNVVLSEILHTLLDQGYNIYTYNPNFQELDGDDLVQFFRDENELSDEELKLLNDFVVRARTPDKNNLRGTIKPNLQTLQNRLKLDPYVFEDYTRLVEERQLDSTEAELDLTLEWLQEEAQDKEQEIRTKLIRSMRRYMDYLARKEMSKQAKKEGQQENYELTTVADLVESMQSTYLYGVIRHKAESKEEALVEIDEVAQEIERQQESLVADLIQLGYEADLAKQAVQMERSIQAEGEGFRGLIVNFELLHKAQPEISISDFKTLLNYDYITTLNLRSSTIYGLPELPRLRHLNLRGASIDDGQLERLKQITLTSPHLMTLDLGQVFRTHLIDVESGFKKPLADTIIYQIFKHHPNPSNFSVTNFTGATLTDVEVPNVYTGLKDFSRQKKMAEFARKASFLTYDKQVKALEEFFEKNNIKEGGFIVGQETQEIKINFTGFRVTDEALAFLGQLTFISELNLRGSGIRDVHFLSKLKRLKKLYLSQNPIEDISALAHLPLLHTVRLTNTKVRNLYPLTKNPSLSLLGVMGTPVDNRDKDQIFAFIRDHQNRADLTVEYRDYLDKSISITKNQMRGKVLLHYGAPDFPEEFKELSFKDQVQLVRDFLSKNGLEESEHLNYNEVDQEIYLDLSGTDVSNNDLVFLRRLTYLQRLNISKTGLTPLGYIANLPRLVGLELNNMKEGVSLEFIYGKLPRLMYIEASGAGLDEQAVSDLISRHPHRVIPAEGDYNLRVTLGPERSRRFSVLVEDSHDEYSFEEQKYLLKRFIRKIRERVLVSRTSTINLDFDDVNQTIQLTLNDVDLTAGDLKELAHFTYLTALNLRDNLINDVTALQSLKRLEFLNLELNLLSKDTGLKPLHGKLPALELLRVDERIRKDEVYDFILAHEKKNKIGNEALAVERDGVEMGTEDYDILLRDESSEDVPLTYAEQKGVIVRFMRRVGISQEVMRYDDKTETIDLDFSRSSSQENLSDQDIRFLSRLSNLKSLNLNSQPITSLDFLHGKLPKLEELILFDAALSNEDAYRFIAAHPNREDGNPSLSVLMPSGPSLGLASSDGSMYYTNPSFPEEFKTETPGELSDEEEVKPLSFEEQVREIKDFLMDKNGRYESLQQKITLTLQNVTLTKADFEKMIRWTNLSYLDLMDVDIREEGISVLNGELPNLRRLHLKGSNVDDESVFRFIANHPNREAGELHRLQVVMPNEKGVMYTDLDFPERFKRELSYDEQVSEIQEFLKAKNLESVSLTQRKGSKDLLLELRAGKLTREDLQKIARWTHIVDLSIPHLNVNGLPALNGKLPRLRMLTLSEASATEEQTYQFIAQHPNREALEVVRGTTGIFRYYDDDFPEEYKQPLPPEGAVPKLLTDSRVLPASLYDSRVLYSDSSQKELPLVQQIVTYLLNRENVFARVLKRFEKEGDPEIFHENIHLPRTFGSIISPVTAESLGKSVAIDQMIEEEFEQVSGELTRRIASLDSVPKIIRWLYSDDFGSMLGALLMRSSQVNPRIVQSLVLDIHFAAIFGTDEAEVELVVQPLSPEAKQLLSLASPSIIEAAFAEWPETPGFDTALMERLGLEVGGFFDQAPPEIRSVGIDTAIIESLPQERKEVVEFLQKLSQRSDILIPYNRASQKIALALFREVVGSVIVSYGDNGNGLTERKLRKLKGNGIALFPEDVRTQLREDSELKQSSIRMDRQLVANANMEINELINFIKTVLYSKLRYQLKDDGSSRLLRMDQEVFNDIVMLFNYLSLTRAAKRAVEKAA